MGALYQDRVEVVRVEVMGAGDEEVKAQGPVPELAPEGARAEVARATSQVTRSGEGTERLLTDGETVFVPGQGPDIPTEVRVGSGIGIAPGRLLPYEQIWGEYAEQAREHMERSPVPPWL